MYRKIYRDKILYYLATQRFITQKPCNKTPILRYADPTPGVPTLLLEETPTIF